MEAWAAATWELIGAGVPAELRSALDLAMRAAVIYATALVLVRLVDRRRLGQSLVVPAEGRWLDPCSRRDERVLPAR